MNLIESLFGGIDMSKTHKDIHINFAPVFVMSDAAAKEVVKFLKQSTSTSKPKQKTKKDKSEKQSSRQRRTARQL